MSAVKYKPGDRVMVREDLRGFEGYGGLTAAVRMVELFSGKIVTISGFGTYGATIDSYKIKEDNDQFRWTDEMFADIPIQDNTDINDDNRDILKFFE